MEITMVLFLPRDAASVPVSRQVLDGCLETLGVTQDTRTDIALALSEACANVIQHAGPGDEYEVLASARDGRCVIEVVNTGDGAGTASPGGAVLAPGGGTRHGPGLDGPALDGPVLDAAPVPPTAEHGRGLQIIDAVTDSLWLTGNGRAGTTVHFEKVLSWVPGAAGEHLSGADG